MKNPALFYGAILLVVIGIVGGIYYVVPSITHVLATPPTGPHYKHAALFFVLAVIGVVTVLVSRPKAA